MTWKVEVLLLLLATGCGAFSAEDTPGASQADAGAADAAPSEGGGGTDGGIRTCTSLTAFADEFERDNGMLQGAWTKLIMMNATLSLDGVTPLRDTQSLKVDVGAGTPRSAFFELALAADACSVDASFWLRPETLTGSVSLLRVAYTGSHIDLRYENGGLFMVESVDGGLAKKTPLDTLTDGTVKAVEFHVDLTAGTGGQVTFVIGPAIGSPTTTSRIDFASHHVDPQSLQLGAIDVADGTPFAYHLDHFALK